MKKKKNNNNNNNQRIKETVSHVKGDILIIHGFLWVNFGSQGVKVENSYLLGESATERNNKIRLY
jgi:hypothetical protein